MGGGGSGPTPQEVSASVSGKNIPDTPREWCDLKFLQTGRGRSKSWVGSFPRTKWEVLNGTKIELFLILSVILNLTPHFETQYLSFGAKVLILGAKISISCLFNVKRWRGGG